MLIYYRVRFRSVLRWVGKDVHGVYPAGPPDSRYIMSLTVNDSWPYLLGVYEHAVVSYWRRTIRSGATIVDVGGHGGYHALYLAHLTGPSGRVVILEPVAELADTLHINIGLNRLHNCDVRGEAASAADGEIDLFIPRGKLRSSIATTSPARAEDADHVRRTVPAVRLDSVAQSVGRVDFVKIDVEGAEAAVLRGCPDLLSDPGCIFLLEVNEWITEESQEVLELLRQDGARHRRDRYAWSYCLPSRTPSGRRGVADGAWAGPPHNRLRGPAPPNNLRVRSL
jgi:FkbM family methyltransferase